MDSNFETCSNLGVTHSQGPKRGAPQRLAINQMLRMRRIVDAAVGLAEKGGFEAVRLRDVAEKSGVALGTFYKYFRSKEDLLLFALNEEFEQLEALLVKEPARGGTALARVVDFFERATQLTVLRSRQFAIAVLRALAVGDPETALKIAAFQMRSTRLITAALRGESADLSAPLASTAGSVREQEISFMLLQVWHSSLVGWAAGLHADAAIAAHIAVAAELVLEGGRTETSGDLPRAVG